MGMTLEEKGAYIELLMMQFNVGHMDGHMCGQLVGQNWDKLKHKFAQDESGKWYNERLEAEINKRKAFTISRKNNLTGKNQYTKKIGHKDGHMTTHMENENENVIEVEIEKEKVGGLGEGKGNGMISVTVDRLELTLQQEISWLESIARKYKCSIEYAKQKIPDFILHLKTQGEEAKTIKDAKSHYDNWFRITQSQQNGTFKKTGGKNGIDLEVVARGLRERFSPNE